MGVWVGDPHWVRAICGTFLCGQEKAGALRYQALIPAPSDDILLTPTSEGSATLAPTVETDLLLSPTDERAM
jgi:hypothetical protein